MSLPVCTCGQSTALCQLHFPTPWQPQYPTPYQPTYPSLPTYPTTPVQVPASIPTGWICPKCSKVFSPNTHECWYCNLQKAQTVIAKDGQ